MTVTSLLERDRFFARAYAALMRDCARSGEAFVEPSSQTSTLVENVLRLRSDSGHLLATYEAARAPTGGVIVRRMHDAPSEHNNPRAWPTITVDLLVLEVAELEDLLRMMFTDELDRVAGNGEVVPWPAAAVSCARKLLAAIDRAIEGEPPTSPGSRAPGSPSPGRAS